MASCYFPEKIDAFSREEITPPVEVDGFRSVIEDIDGAIKAVIAAEKPRPLFVLIAGESGTGRTAAAKYVLDQFVRLAGIVPAKFILPRVEMNYDVQKLLGDWLEKLAVEAAEAQFIAADLATETLAKIEAAQGTFKGQFALLIQRYVKELNKRALFGVLFEDVLDVQSINAAKMVFQSAPAPCVFTVVQMPESAGKNDPTNEKARKVREAFDSIPADRRLLIELSSLTGEEVALFAKKHWIATNSDGEPPFDDEGVRAVFSDKRRKIGTARTLLGRLHNIKLETEPDSPPWGENRLARIMPNIVLGDE